MNSIVIFSNVDRTLLDFKTYEYKDSKRAIAFLIEKKIPLIFVSSKTQAELEYLRQIFGIDFPYIFENGAGICIPESSLIFEKQGDKKGNFYFIYIGEKRENLITFLKSMKMKGFRIRLLSEMEDGEIRKITALAERDIPFLKNRMCSEPFLLLNGEIETIQKEAEKKGFFIHKGRRFYYLTGPVTKKSAILKLLKLCRLTNVVSIGIGDSLNDEPMFSAVDFPFLLQKEKGIWEELQDFNGVRVPFPGQKGFSWVIFEWLVKKFKGIYGSLTIIKDGNK